MKKEIKIPTGIVMAIGKFKVFQTEQFKYSIPTLSFIVARKDNVYTASCLHLLLDASGKNDVEAINNLRDACEEYLTDIFNEDEKNAWEQLHELFTADCIGEFWNGYRDFQLNLSEKNVSTDSTMVKFLTQRIEQLKKQLAEYEETRKEISIDVVSLDRAA